MAASMTCGCSLTVLKSPTPRPPTSAASGCGCAGSAALTDAALQQVYPWLFDEADAECSCSTAFTDEALREVYPWLLKEEEPEPIDDIEEAIGGSPLLKLALAQLRARAPASEPTGGAWAADPRPKGPEPVVDVQARKYGGAAGSGGGGESVGGEIPPCDDGDRVWACGEVYSVPEGEEAEYCTGVAAADGSCVHPAYVFSLPCDFEPPTDLESRQETLDFVWANLHLLRDENKRFTFGRYNRFIHDKASFNALDTVGTFWNEDGTRPRDQIFFLYCIALIDWLRGDIPNVDEPTGVCDDIATLVADGFFQTAVASTEPLYRIGFSTTMAGSPEVVFEQAEEIENISCSLNPGGFPTSISGEDGMEAGLTDWYSNEISMNSRYVSAMAQAADAWLTLANALYWFVVEGRVDTLETALRYLRMARDLGRLALAVIVEVSATLLHEMVHVFLHRNWVGGHCSSACCPNQVGVLWRCSVIARLGLPAMAPFSDDNTTFDLSRGAYDASLYTLTSHTVPIWTSSASVCGLNDEVFVGHCRADSPGVSDPSAGFTAENVNPCSA